MEGKANGLVKDNVSVGAFYKDAWKKLLQPLICTSLRRVRECYRYDYHLIGIQVCLRGHKR